MLRFRGARGDQRQQLKWITSAAVVWVLGVAAIYFAPPGLRSVMEVVYALVLGGFVAAFGVGILKYRLRPP